MDISDVVKSQDLVVLKLLIPGIKSQAIGLADIDHLNGTIIPHCCSKPLIESNHHHELITVERIVLNMNVTDNKFSTLD